MPMTKRWDILGLGCAAVDDLLYVPEFPPPDAKVRVDKSQRQCGGLGATSLVAAARLGSRCAYASILGEDELSRFVESTLEREGIDTSIVVRRSDGQPIHSVIIVDGTRHTRNIFYEIAGRTGADDDLPSADAVRDARVLFVDHYGMAGNIRLARAARQGGVGIVADIEHDDVPRFDELLALVDHLILSLDFAARITGAADAADAASRLWRSDRQAVVVTCGANGCWYVGKDDDARPRHFPAFRVQTVDTTGCGDVFHGAYACALAQGMSMPDRIRFASAAAAIKATQPGGQRGIPNRAAVDAFLKIENPPHTPLASRNAF